MDDLYDNLDNYNEEATIAELREDNKELKSKLEKYAFTLDKLQNEFDMLASEHKKLEQNYSSLLKTAKSEIERKSQIITKLNIEKDKMVLSAIQNQNISYKKNRTEPKKSKADDERRRNNSPSEVNKQYTNTQTRLLDLVNSTLDSQKSIKNQEVKENIMLRDDAVKSRARISNRRKSMPVFSMDSAILTDEDEFTSTESTKESNSRQKTDYAKKHTNRFMHDKAVEERIFGQYVPSKESQICRNSYPYGRERSKEKYESNQKHRRNYSSDNRKGSLEGHRVSPGRGKGSLDRKRFSPDRRRVSPERRRISPERRRLSPDRRRFSPDRRRISPERRRVSPVRGRLSSERNRREPREHIEEFRENPEYDRHRKFYEKNHNQDYDRPKSRTQDKYPIKHKLTDVKDTNVKRMRMDHQYEEDILWRNETESSALENAPQSLNFEYLNNMSCQSPEQTFLDGLAQAPREIKLTATMKLDDPRISSKKYVMMPHKGKPELTSLQNSNTDIKIIDTHAWDMIKRMKLPDALVQKPPSIDSPLTLFQKSLPPTIVSYNPQPTACDMVESIKTPELPLHTQLTDEPEPVQNITQKTVSSNDLIDEIYMDIDKPLSDISIESGEIDFDEENQHTKHITEKTTQEKIKQPGCTKLDGKYKIPKKGKTKPDKPSNFVELRSTDKQKDNQIPKNKVKSPVDKKKVDEIHNIRDTGHNKKANRKVTKEDAKQDTGHAKNIPICRSDTKCDFRNNITTKDIENDLELSDEASDNTDVHLTKPVVFSNEKKKSDIKDIGHQTEVHKSQLPDQPTCEFIVTHSGKDNHDFTDRKKNIEFKIIETAKDSKKPKTKKKSPKQKDNKESFKNKDNLISRDKPTNELPKTDDTEPSVDKQAKQSDNNSEKSVINVTPSIKESKMKETFELSEPPHDKPAKKKQIKPTEPPEQPAPMDQPYKEKETKVNKIENKTKFCELFGDSSSLVCPEDLGLVPAVVPSSNLAYFEDAQDAMDMDTLQAAIAITSLNKTNDKTQKTKCQTNFDKDIDKTTAISNEIKPTTSLPVLSTEPILVQSVYQNLQPVSLSNEHNVVNSIIISSGTQPQYLEGTYPITNGTETNLHIMQCVKPIVIQDLALQALATSTPQKIWNQNILPEPTCNSKCESNESVDKTPTIDHSGDTDTSQTKHNDEPDLKLFVTRRRKVKRK